jgi:23S rRNA pseudouridine1911/1915/1917 synthase
MTKQSARPISQLNIIYQDDDIIIIDKPANLIVHPDNPNQKNTLIDQLIKYCPSIKNIGDEPLRPGIVHRLDKDTSGLIVVAKNNQAFEHLKKQFQERKVIKKYLALVHGQVKNNKGTITKAISPSRKSHLKRSALLNKNAKSAWTEYRVIKKFNNYTLLEVYPKTGRTHQIRVHLASIGHPIAGDKQYKFKRQTAPEGLSRQFLHAAYLKFKLPSGKIMKFQSELPKDLKKVLLNLDLDRRG